MIVDDNDELRDLLRRVLERDGRFTIIGEVSNGRDAIPLVESLRPDLVVLDIAMPMLDGIAALPRLRQVSADSRVVMVSGYPADQMEPASIEGGAVGYIDKATEVGLLPAQLHALAAVLDTVQRVLDASYGSDVHSPRSARLDVKNAIQEAIDGGSLDVVELLTSELVTNAIQHAHTSAQVAVELVGGTRVRVSVTDNGAGELVAGRPNGDAETGRGLGLVEDLALRWGVQPLESGKTVWFETDVAS